jgi:hypothetical protein
MRSGWHLKNWIQNQQYNKKPKQQLGGKEIYGWYSGSKWYIYPEKHSCRVNSYNSYGIDFAKYFISWTKFSRFIVWNKPQITILQRYTKKLLLKKLTMKSVRTLWTCSPFCREACAVSLNHHYIRHRAGQGCTEKNKWPRGIHIVEQGRAVAKIFRHDLLVVGQEIEVARCEWCLGGDGDRPSSYIADPITHIPVYLIIIVLHSTKRKKNE